MTALSDFAAAVRALAAGVRAAADDPADQVRLLAELGRFDPDPAAGAGTLGVALAAAETAAGDLCRRAALTELARACADYRASSYEDGIALRDLVCGMLQAEELRAADAGQDATFAAFRALRVAVAVDLTTRIADLARLQVVQVPGTQPALVLAYRLYGDATRAEELANSAAAPAPAFMPTTFRARDR